MLSRIQELENLIIIVRIKRENNSYSSFKLEKFGKKLCPKRKINIVGGIVDSF